jgi:hydroxypyruvate reductase
MAHGLAGVLGQRVSQGIILTKDGHAPSPPAGWDVFEASHPVPDDRGVRGTRAILDRVGVLGRGDIAIVLVSGGGSALLEAPRQTLGLSDIQETTRLLLNAGAPIQHLNAVRSELSLVKGGGLRRSIGEATCISLILSDVLGNDPTVIASGPTVAREPNPAAALDLLETYGLVGRVPEAVTAMLRSGRAAIGAPDTSSDSFVVVGDNNVFIEAVNGAARGDGMASRIELRQAEGEARVLARTFIESAENQPGEVEAVIGGGEATVTVRGQGIGGRNTEFALAAAISLRERGLDWAVASLASDGQDGLIDAAGAIVDRHTVAAGEAIGLDARRFLDNNDSGEYFRRLGLLVEPGPTGTNVNDVYVAVKLAG